MFDVTLGSAHKGSSSSHTVTLSFPLCADWESMERRTSLPLVSLSPSSSQALELIKPVITQRCVCLLLQIPELDKSFQGCSLKCHVMSRVTDIWPLNVFFCMNLAAYVVLQSAVLHSNRNTSISTSEMVTFLQCIYIVILTAIPMSFWNNWSEMVRRVFFKFYQNPVNSVWNNGNLERAGMLRCIIIPSFIKIQSAESWIWLWDIDK